MEVKIKTDGEDWHLHPEGAEKRALAWTAVCCVDGLTRDARSRSDDRPAVAHQQEGFS